MAGDQSTQPYQGKLMTKYLPLTALVLLTACASVPAPVLVQDAAVPATINQLQGFQSHVDIKNMYSVRKDNQVSWYQSASSGIIVNHGDEKLILTCAHSFLEGGENLQVGIGRDPVNMYAGAADVVKIDREKDLMLLRVAYDFEDSRPADIATTVPSVGQTVYVHGNTQGFGSVTTRGMVSVVRDELILADAIVYKGNSGGGMYHNGELVGVVLRRLENGVAIAAGIDVINDFLKD